MLVTTTTARGDHRTRDLKELIDYRAYGGSRNFWFEEKWLKPRLQAMGYDHVRFFGGEICDYDGSFRERTCEVKRPAGRVEYFVYG
jgi:hypothetical protein